MKRSSLKTFLTKALASLLIALTLVPSLASCSDTEEIDDTIIPVYTFYGIKGEGTTDEAIRAVELSINRILMSRYTFAVDFRLFFEDEYEEALNAAIKEVEEYEESEDDTEESLASGELPSYTYTEDKVIELLESGKDFEFKAPRVDIILCKDSEQYFELANSKKLVAIDTTLENEGKILSEYIHPTLLSLAKIGRKTFGVPNNAAMGEYEYIVFDKQYLDEHKYDYKTMKSLEDLEDYLSLIKEKNENVIPLKKAGTPVGYEYLFGDNSPFYISPTTTTSGEATGRIYGTLDTSFYSFIIDDYATLIGKYRSLGYLADPSDKNKDFAVTFVKGTPSDIDALEKETGKEYEYIVYKTPVATTKSIDTVYSISSSVSTTEVTTVIDIIVALFTDEQIKNYFYYGIQGEHYILDDNDLVEPIKNGDTDKFDYVMENKYTGNIYLAKQKQGENGKIYDDIKQINLATSLSLTSGFAYIPKTYTVGDKTLTEPNYVEIMTGILGEGVLKLNDGSFGIVNYDEFKASMETSLKELAEESVTTAYSEKILADYVAKNSDFLSSEEFLSQVQKEAVDFVNNSLTSDATNALKIEYTKQLKTENPDITDEEIAAILDTKITEEAIKGYIDANFTAVAIQNHVDKRKNILIANAETNLSKEYKESAEYKNLMASYVVSEDFKVLVEEYINSQGDNYIDKKFLAHIGEQITAETEKLQAEASEAILKAIKQFNETAKSTFNWSDADAENNLDVNSYSDFVEKRLKAQYYSVYTNPDATTTE